MRKCGQHFQALWICIRNHGLAGCFETLSHICITLALFVAYYEYRHNLAKQNLDSALGIYQEVGHAYVKYVKLCFEQPKLDCYTVSSRNGSSPPLSDQEQLQQKILFDMLTVVFETAYVHYLKFIDRAEGDESKRLFGDQWQPWDNYIKRFVTRPTYLSVWFDVEDGYDRDFRCHMKTLILEAVEPTAAQTLDQSLQSRLNTWLAQPEIERCHQ
jgi:hypothetical protein